jgi:hypothetical protein
MKPEQLLQALKDLAEKLDVHVSEENFRNAGIKVSSGLCKIKGEFHYILDKHKSTKKKIRLLAEALSRMPLDDMYILPLVRETLDRYGDTSSGISFGPEKPDFSIAEGEAAAESEELQQGGPDVSTA